MAIAQGCPSLMALNLDASAEITDNGLLSLAQNCDDLRDLRLDSAYLITDVGVQSLSSGKTLPHFS